MDTHGDPPVVQGTKGESRACRINRRAKDPGRVRTGRAPGTPPGGRSSRSRSQISSKISSPKSHLNLIWAKASKHYFKSHLHLI